MNSGHRSGPIAAASCGVAGPKKHTACRIARTGRPSGARSDGAHGPGVATTVSASYRPRSVSTTAQVPSARQARTGSSKRRSAPDATAARCSAATHRSGNRMPACGSHSPTRPSGSANAGNRRRTSCGVRSSYGRPCTWALRSAPATTGAAAGPIMSPPVGSRSRSPETRSSSSQSAYARSSSGTYAGSSKYALRMIRVCPCDAPSRCPGGCASSPRTRRPRPESRHAAALPITPSPMTISS